MKIERVHGAQAEGAERLGLIKITRASAKRLFDLGVPLVIVGSNVNDYHFFGGWHLAHTMDPKRAEREGVSFDSYARSFEVHLEPELGRHASFFIRRSELPAALAGTQKHLRKIVRSWR